MARVMKTLFWTGLIALEVVAFAVFTVLLAGFVYLVSAI